MRRRGITARGFALAGALLTAGFAARPAPAGEPSSEAAPDAADAQVRLTTLELHAAMSRLFGGRDVRADAEEAHTIAPMLGDSASKVRLTKVTGRILDATRTPDLERTCIETLAVLGEPAGFAYLRRFLFPPFVDAIRAAGKIGSPEAAFRLFHFVARGEPGLAVEALGALGELGRRENAREAVLSGLLNVLLASTTVRVQAGSSPVPRVPPRGRQGPFFEALVRALNAVTGRDLATEADWVTLVAGTPREDLVLKSVSSAPEVTVAASPALRAEVDAWVARARAHANDADTLRADLEAMAALAGRIEDPGLRIPLSEVVGELLESTEDPETQRAGIVALGSLRSPGSFARLRRFLEADVTASNLDTRLAAIDATARTRTPAAVPYLLAVVDGESARVATRALVALGAYVREPGGEALALRVVDLVRNHGDDQPAGSRPPPCVPGPDDRSRYQMVAAAMTERLNLWTGRDLPNPKAWYALVDAHREDPKALFLR